MRLRVLFPRSRAGGALRTAAFQASSERAHGSCAGAAPSQAPLRRRAVQSATKSCDRAAARDRAATAEAEPDPEDGWQEQHPRARASDPAPPGGAPAPTYDRALYREERAQARSGWFRNRNSRRDSRQCARAIPRRLRAGQRFPEISPSPGPHGAAAQVFRQLIWPKRLDNRRQFIEPGGNEAHCGSFRMLDAARVIEDDVARLAARSVGARFGELAEGMAQRRNRNAPHVGSAQDGGFFTRRKLQPEFIDKLFAVRVRCPGDRQRREMLRRVRAGIPAGLDNDVAQAANRRTDR